MGIDSTSMSVIRFVIPYTAKKMLKLPQWPPGMVRSLNNMVVLVLLEVYEEMVFIVSYFFSFSASWKMGMGDLFCGGLRTNNPF